MATILIVDDRLMNREFLVTLLRYGNHRVVEATDGVSALKMITDEKPDLVITDILMPTMDGFAMVKELQKDSELAHIPVIFYTATYRLEEGRRLAESCGVQYVLSKPCEPEVILRTVNEALGTTEQVVAIEEKTAENVTPLIAVENRLVSITEFNFNLIGERDPLRLLKTFCKGLCKMIGAKYAAMGIFHYSGEALKHFVEMGTPELSTQNTIDEYISQFKTTRKIVKKPHFIGAPLLTPSNFYGFFYVKNKIEGTDFTDEDMELVRLFTSEVAVLYENLDMYDSIQRHAANLQVERARADDANHAKSAFLATVSHELRTPLTAIIGYSEIMQEMAAEAKLTTYTQSIDKILYSSNHLLNLINDILDLSKIEAGRMEIYLEDVDVPHLIKDVESLIRPLLNATNNQLHVNIDVSDHVMHTDSMRLRQSLLNLLNNANKFTSNGKISLDVITTNSMVQFSVTDTGVGISSDVMPRLFQSFSQGDSTTTRKYGGTGLGLYLTKCFCEMLGGTISVSSSKKEGTVFTITLPQRSRLGATSFDLINSPDKDSTK